MIWLLIILAVLICLATLLLLPVEIRVRYEHFQEDDQGIIELRYLGGLIHIKRELTKIQVGVTDNGPAVGVKTESKANESHGIFSAADLAQVFRELGPLLEFMRISSRIVRQSARHLHVRFIHLEANVGLSDAVVTGTSVGVLYMVLESLFGYMGQFCRLRQVPSIAIHPVFNQFVLQVRTQSIMSIRLGYAISAGIRLLLAWKRRT
ncbi:DUF2953 domain-containing protein [Alicyclobacillus fastidiosus]|uniref:DUF2953 domain-containing protein n=1 Tax=Alicyclobacillus fastidiosus TaxID=392011 RepID=A0ABY6ZQC5_9BACL|nr:DUF2953 domain-containing protein [Alicyclobacillus fastidiosus]WAH44361.1 DUF2953 domain-containing protein [Alicyclobacillus fastidiosus]GMA60693.1 hypothetical protein GCM10025859_11330 [Alicyclobacillus fastidiosus]